MTRDISHHVFAPATTEVVCWACAWNSRPVSSLEIHSERGSGASLAGSMTTAAFSAFGSFFFTGVGSGGGGATTA